MGSDGAFMIMAVIAMPAMFMCDDRHIAAVPRALTRSAKEPLGAKGRRMIARAA